MDLREQNWFDGLRGSFSNDRSQARSSVPTGVLSRRSALRQIGLAGLSLAATPAWANEMVKLPLAGDPRERSIASDFPQKGRMILQRTGHHCLKRRWKCSIAASSRRTTNSMCAGIGP
jgi:hypothetical protein